MDSIKMNRIKWTFLGIRRVMKSDEAEADLRRRADRIAEAARGLAAGIMVDGVPGDKAVPIVVDSRKGARRARASVAINHPAGAAVEAKHLILTRAINAARD